MPEFLLRQSTASVVLSANIKFNLACYRYTFSYTSACIHANASGLHGPLRAVGWNVVGVIGEPPRGLGPCEGFAIACVIT